MTAFCAQRKFESLHKLEVLYESAAIIEIYGHSSALLRNNNLEEQKLWLK